MTIQQAIEKAIEGGWGMGSDQNEKLFPFVRDVWSDPLFWQSLGKALGWGDESECPLACCGGICPINIPMWQSQWHRFVDALSEGKSADDFFSDL